jgi:2-dehydropantoate 2-reductase
MDTCREKGLLFVSPAGEELLTGFRTAASAKELPVQDIVILMVKATQTESIIPDLKTCVGPETAVVSLQNGLGNDELLERYFPAERILYGFGTIGTELPEPGKCVSKPESGIIMRFGAVKKSAFSERAGRALEACFIAGGCETVFEEDIRPFVWKKAISNSGYNTLSALLRLKVGDFLDQEAGVQLIRSVWEEGCKVCEAVTGFDLRADLEEELPRLRTGFASYFPSMAQDVLIHHRQTEIDLLNGAIVRYGEKTGITTPVNEALVRMITCMQSAYDRQYGL